MRSKKLYKVTFLSQGKTLELYARHIGSSALWGFTEVGELVFEPGLLHDVCAYVSVWAQMSELSARGKPLLHRERERVGTREL